MLADSNSATPILLAIRFFWLHSKYASKAHQSYHFSVGYPPPPEPSELVIDCWSLHQPEHLKNSWKYLPYFGFPELTLVCAYSCRAAFRVAGLLHDSLGEGITLACLDDFIR